MLEAIHLNTTANFHRIDKEEGIIFGVCVMKLGQAKGHDFELDDESLDGFLRIAIASRDGVKTRFGDDHDAGAADINGTLKNFRREGDSIRADHYLLKSDANFSKLIEMAEKMPHQFGLSAVGNGNTEKVDGKKMLRFSDVSSVDFVSNAAATRGLFLSANQKQPTKTMLNDFAIALGLPETATEAEITVALAAMKEKLCKMSEKEKKEKEDKAKAELEAKGGDDKKELAALTSALESIKLDVVAIKASSQAAQDAAHKAEVENLKLEASRDGKVIPLSDATILKLSVPEIKEMISKLPKQQIQLSRRSVTPVNAEGKAITDKNSPEFKAHLARAREQGAIELGRLMVGAVNLQN